MRLDAQQQREDEDHRYWASRAEEDAAAQAAEEKAAEEKAAEEAAAAEVDPLVSAVMEQREVPWGEIDWATPTLVLILAFVL